MSRLRGFAAAGAMFASSFTGAACSGENPDLELRRCNLLSKDEQTISRLAGAVLYTLTRPGEANSSYYDRLIHNEFGGDTAPDDVVFAPAGCNREPITPEKLFFDGNGDYLPLHVNAMVSGENTNCIVVALIGSGPSPQTQDFETAMIDGNPIVQLACPKPSK